MTAKEIYESIDLSQLPKESAEKLRKVEKATEGFTIESDKVNNFMNSVYKKIKENKPTALKNLKVEEKVTKTEVKKGDTTQVVEDLEYKVKGTKKVTKKTPTPSKPTKKSTFLGEVKKRKKKGEDWEVAKARVKKELDEERAKAKADAEKVVSKTSQALKNLEKMLKDDPKLAGYPRTYGKQSKKIDAAKDAKIKAKPAGKRVSKKGHKNQYGESKGGRVYWENRDNRSDRYAPDFPNKVFLEVGGELDDLGFPMGHTYLVVEVSPSGDKKLIKKTTDYITALTSSAVARGMKSSKDARVVIVDMEEKRVIHEAFEAGGEITITPTQLINNPDALVGTTTMTELFECGGVTAYQEGGEVFVTPYPLTNAGSADYVAGSNTMSNMFEDGGVVNLYFGGEREDETRDVDDEADAMRLAMQEGAEHYEFVPSSFATPNYKSGWQKIKPIETEGVVILKFDSKRPDERRDVDSERDAQDLAEREGADSFEFIPSTIRVTPNMMANGGEVNEYGLSVKKQGEKDYAEWFPSIESANKEKERLEAKGYKVETRYPAAGWFLRAEKDGESFTQFWDEKREAQAIFESLKSQGYNVSMGYAFDQEGTRVGDWFANGGEVNEYGLSVKKQGEKDYAEWFPSIESANKEKERLEAKGYKVETRYPAAGWFLRAEKDGESFTQFWDEKREAQAIFESLKSQGYNVSMGHAFDQEGTRVGDWFAKGGQVSLGMKKDLEFFEDIRVKTLNMENKQGILLKYGFVEPEDAKKYEKESGYKFKEDKSIAGVIDVKNNKAFSQGIEDGDKYFFFFNTTQPDRVVIIDAFDGDKLSATRADNKRAYLSLKLFLLDLRLETSGTKMAKGGQVDWLETQKVISVPYKGKKINFKVEYLDYDELYVFDSKTLKDEDLVEDLDLVGMAGEPSPVMNLIKNFLESKIKGVKFDEVVNYPADGYGALRVQGLIKEVPEKFETEYFTFSNLTWYKDGMYGKAVEKLLPFKITEKRIKPYQGAGKGLMEGAYDYTLIGKMSPKKKFQELTKMPKKVFDKMTLYFFVNSNGNLNDTREEAEVWVFIEDHEGKGEHLFEPFYLDELPIEDIEPLVDGEDEIFESIDELREKYGLWSDDFESYANGGTIVAADPSAAMEDLNQTYGYESVYEKGGRLGFEGLAKKVAKRYEGKPVKAKYQKDYGKTYSKEEAMEVGRKVAAKVYGQQQANMKKMAKGGEVTFDNDYYGFSARVPYMGKTYLVEMGKNWNAPFDEVVISDGFTRIDGAGAKNIYLAMLKAKQNAEMPKFAKGGEMSKSQNFEVDFYGWKIGSDRKVPAYSKSYTTNHQMQLDELISTLQNDLRNDKSLSRAEIYFVGDDPEKDFRYMGSLNDLDNTGDWVFRQGRVRTNFAKGGSLMGHGLEVGDKIVKDLGSALKVSTKDGNIVYVDLASGYREKDMPLPFAKGGKVSGMTIPEIAKKFDRTTADVFSQLQVGEAHEMEHTSDPKVARKIALDHLAEDLDYYTKLKKLGL